jgi:hypothetical protein
MKTKRKKILKILILLIVAAAGISCLNMKKSEYYISFTGPVEITHVIIPDTAVNMSNINIKVHSEASDGCWRNLNFLLNKTSDFEYTLEAFGSYESTGTCPPGVVYGDTTIDFQPKAAGLYKFHVTKSQYVTEIDTMIVK